MKTNRALLSLAIVLTAPSAAAAQRFAGVMDASGMLSRPTVSATVTPVSGFPSLFSAGTALIPPAGFYTPAQVPQFLISDAVAPSPAVQTVFVPVPVPAAPTEVIEVPVNTDALALRRPRTAAAFREPVMTERTLVVTESAGGTIARCQTMVLRQLRVSNVLADDLRFDPNRISWSTRGETADVRGGGLLLDANRQQWRRFTYYCEAGAQPAQTRAAVTLDPPR
jgi:hypothetical protein